MVVVNRSAGSVLSLAHELGHAWHNHCLMRVANLPLAQSSAPSTLAESSSLLFEQLVARHGLIGGSKLPSERVHCSLALLVTPTDSIVSFVQC